jgi:hypothetical protein
MLRAFAVAIVVLGLCSTSYAEMAGKCTNLGEGNTSCGSWLEQRRDPRQWKNEAAWVLGYLTAINQFVWHGGSNIIKGTDPSGVEAWLDAHCGANPLDNIHTSTQILYNELAQRQNRRN